VLKHSGELPGQYFLEYYTDRTYRKLKGKIDLDQCDQVTNTLRLPFGIQLRLLRSETNFLYFLESPPLSLGNVQRNEHFGFLRNEIGTI